MHSWLRPNRGSSNFQCISAACCRITVGNNIYSRWCVVYYDQLVACYPPVAATALLQFLCYLLELKRGNNAWNIFVLFLCIKFTNSCNEIPSSLCVLVAMLRGIKIRWYEILLSQIQFYLFTLLLRIKWNVQVLFTRCVFGAACNICMQNRVTLHQSESKQRQWKTITLTK